MLRTLIAVVLAIGCTSPLTPSGQVPARDYDRDAWGSWIDEDGDCLDTRHEVLLDESLVSATVADCRVVAGLWRDIYTGRIYSDPAILDVDHVVALREAHDAGGWLWTRERRVDYANDLDQPDHLVAVHRSVNRSKGARGPDEWLPEVGVCRYVAVRAAIFARWGLDRPAGDIAASGAC